MNELTNFRLPRMLGMTEGATPFTWLRQEIDSLFDNVSRPGRAMLPGGERSLLPAVDLAESDKEYTLTAEIPGLSDDDIELSVADGVLKLTGKKSEQSEQKDNGFLLRERRFGSFERHIPLPDDSALEAIKAKYDGGVLTLTIPKDENARSRVRKIEIE